RSVAHVATTSSHTPYAASLAVPLAGEPCEHERMLRLGSQVQASRRVDPSARLAAGRAGGRIRTDVFGRRAAPGLGASDGSRAAPAEARAGQRSRQTHGGCDSFSAPREPGRGPPPPPPPPPRGPPFPLRRGARR